MERINDTELLKCLLKGHTFTQCFSSLPLDLELRRYNKGEFINTPIQPLKDFCLILDGHIRIYGIRENGSSFSVHMEGNGALLGDMEFCRSDFIPFYTEAITNVLCVVLPMEKHRSELERNPYFLRFLLNSLAEKVMLTARLDRPSQSVEDRILTFLREIQPDHILHSISEGLTYFHCSRRQLQRVVCKLCAEGVLQKIGKGQYQLVTLATRSESSP